MNQKHAKNPIDPVSRKKRNTMMSVYPKYKNVLAASWICNFVAK